jgi:hypothetical protein
VQKSCPGRPGVRACPNLAPGVERL